MSLHSHLRQHQVNLIRREGSPMRAQPIVPSEAIEYVYHVGHRKYNIDEGCAWWRRAFFWYIYLPFVRFSFRHVHIPAMDEVEVSGKKLTFCWYEDGGVFEDEGRANAACRNRFSRVKPLMKNRVYPWETAQQENSHTYPLADKPDRYLQPTFSLITKDRKQDERQSKELSHYIARLNQVLD